MPELVAAESCCFEWHGSGGSSRDPYLTELLRNPVRSWTTQELGQWEDGTWQVHVVRRRTAIAASFTVSPS